jgi:hypothetical protein
VNHENKVREMERAAVDRWFARTPLGPMFNPGKGRMLPIPADADKPWREEAYAIIDRFIVDSRPPPQWAMMAIFLAFFCILLLLQRYTGFGGAEAGGIVFGGVALWHLDDFYRFWRYKRDLAALRARITASLALRSPVPEEIGRRYRRTNPWRTALQLWIFAFIGFVMTAPHWLPPGDVSLPLMFSLVAAVGIAWLLYLLSRRADLAGN